MRATKPPVIAQPAALVCAVLLWTQLAQAHIHKGEAAGFLTGVQHPISGLDHVLAMIAVGLWGAQLGAPAIWVLPVAFPMSRVTLWNVLPRAGNGCTKPL